MPASTASQRRLDELIGADEGARGLTKGG
jgi:hypothetical protein